MFRFASYRGCARVLLASAGAVSLSVGSAHAITLDDITIWTGDPNAENRAGLVIDWNDGKDPVVYGYYFNGSATGADMLYAIFADRSELYAKVTQFSFGDFATGIGIDRDNDGFSVSDGVNTVSDADFTDGIIFLSPGADTDDTTVDADDSYNEIEFWGYSVSDGISPWTSSSVGMSDRVLSDGDWDGWAIPFGTPPSVDVPEPSSLALLGLAGLALVRRRR